MASNDVTAPDAARRGGDWLFGDSSPAEVLTPERLSDEHRMIGRTAAAFAAQEVVPAIPELEGKQWGTARHLIARAAELGLLGTDVPDEYGGIGLDKAASIVVVEAVGGTNGFATLFGAQTGLAVIPILCFGTEAQRRLYLPRLVAGEIIGAYCLSESGSGSDALSARTRAVRQADGSWTLSGEKMWITNGGFADLFIVFAKVDGERFSAFIVERGFPGVSNGKEEHKMGLHGSSTTPMIFQDARVPAENLLGEVGQGHKIAFNVLNYGRFKLCAMCTGGAKRAMGEAAAYALARRQFGRPIAEFGAVRHKLAEMTVRLFGVESMLYRTAGLIDQMIARGAHSPAAVLGALEEFAIEASILKVAGSEMLDYVLDENVQIHGGNGFVSDYPAERHYRDARVNRIFEGTNEINRLLIPGLLVKRGRKGTLPLATLEAEAGGQATADAIKAVGRRLLAHALAVYGDGLDREQEVLTLVADVLIDALAVESADLRARAAEAARAPRADLQADAAAVLAADAAERAAARARTALAAMLTGEPLDQACAPVGRALDLRPVNTIAARRRLADAVSAQRGYPFAAW